MSEPHRVTMMSGMSTSGAAKAGISFGSALAIAISWSEHHSIFWAIVQGFLGWIYVVYFALKR